MLHDPIDLDEVYRPLICGDLNPHMGKIIYTIWTLEGKRYYFSFQNNKVVSVTDYEETKTDDPRKELSVGEKAFFETNKEKFRFRHRSVENRYWITKHENGCPKKYCLIDIDEHQYSKKHYKINKKDTWQTTCL